MWSWTGSKSQGKSHDEVLVFKLLYTYSTLNSTGTTDQEEIYLRSTTTLASGDNCDRLKILYKWWTTEDTVMRGTGKVLPKLVHYRSIE